MAQALDRTRPDKIVRQTENRNPHPLQFRKTLLLNSIPGLNPDIPKISQPNILANEKREPIRLPENFPPNCILVVGDLSRPGEASWYRLTNQENASKTHNLHLNLLSENFSTIPSDDKEVIVVESIPIARRTDLLSDITAGKLGLISNTRLEELRHTMDRGQTLIDLLQRASISPEELKIS